jgi:hypothetical protein
MRYDRRAGQFTYRWRLGGAAGTATLRVQLAYPTVRSLTQQLTVHRG